MSTNMKNKQEKLQEQARKLKEELEKSRESHWIKYCTECPEDIACKDYEI